MPFLASVFRNALNFILTTRSTPSAETYVDGSRSMQSVSAPAKQSDSLHAESKLSSIWGNKKRKADDGFEDEAQTKKQKQGFRNQIEHVSSHPKNTTGVNKLTSDESPDSVKAVTDRLKMPPPITPSNLQGSNRPNRSLRPRVSLDSNDNASQRSGASRSTRLNRSEVSEDYDMEEARRRAAATTLPPNSGIWEPAEQELFFHLSYRGFEPLVPSNWMIDFPTLPLSLFATEDLDEPLIRNHRSTQFRAIKALRDLIDTGKAVRDQVIAQAHTNVRPEAHIERSAKRYIHWALRDIGLPPKSSSMVPVHTIVSMKQRHTTQDTIRELATKMHTLAARHRAACDIHTSIENIPSNFTTSPQEGPELGDGPTTVIDEDENEPNPLPVIYGIMVCSSLFAVFTLNSHSPCPTFLAHLTSTSRGKSIPTTSTSQNGQDKANEEEELGLRFLASFDFSNSSSDVWNALVIAIVAMQIRRTMLEVYDPSPPISSNIDASSEFGGDDSLSLFEEEGGDSSPFITREKFGDGTNVRYPGVLKAYAPKRGIVAMDEDDDPDR